MGFLSVLYRSITFCQWIHHWRKWLSLPYLLLSWSSDPSKKTPSMSKFCWDQCGRDLMKIIITVVSLSATALLCPRVNISHTSTIYQTLIFIPSLILKRIPSLGGSDMIYFLIYHWSITLISSLYFTSYVSVIHQRSLLIYSEISWKSI